MLWPLFLDTQAPFPYTRPAKKRVLIKHTVAQKNRCAMKAKIFTNESNAEILEAELNNWLENNKGVAIKEIKQSFAPSGDSIFFLISVWYQ